LTTAAMSRWRVPEGARRYASIACFWLGLVGVPVAVIVVTGGVQTIGFWIQAILLIPLSMFGLFPVGMALVFLLSPVIWLLDKLMPKRLDRLMERGAVVIGSGLVVVAYLASFDTTSASGVHLPTPWPAVGTLLVFGAAFGMSAGFVHVSGRLDVPRTRTPGSSWPTTPEPKEIFWSDEAVVGWRAWRWTGTRLHGVWSEWDSAEFVAECETCANPPGWSHRCGINAVKTPGDVFRFSNSSEVVGSVEMWGDVVEHEHGYRSSHARITGLWVDDPNLATRLEEDYGVPVHQGRPRLSRGI
jgi:hypothetical protein